MTIEDDVRAADRERRRAMVDGDVAALDALLAEDLVWTHSSGKRDDKRSFLEKLAAGAADYRTLEVAEDAVSAHGGMVLHHGNLTGRVVVDGREKALSNRFLAVWRRSARGFELLAWQSTGF